MPVVLNHLIVPATDRRASAAFLADLLGLPGPGADTGPFTPVRINHDLTFDFDDRRGATPGHYAFLVDDATFDGVLARLRRAREIAFGSGTANGWDREVNHLGGGRGVYVRDPDGHSYELFTAVP
ncbi:VOC family protein [Actinoallomurus sp. CA-142502]|uniref:VOC family protein n=1 Tax=Actinoallomurus sp. CA-142502 TaxID=3239885 RepID=UPI003D91BCFD